MDRASSAAVAFRRSSARFLSVLVAYHKAIGFDEIVICSNPSNDGMAEILAALARRSSSRRSISPHDLLVVRTQDALLNAVSALHDYRVLQPMRMTDPNGNRTVAAFDALGMVVATAVMGKAAPAPAEGDLLEGFDADPLVNPKLGN